MILAEITSQNGEAMEMVIINFMVLQASPLIPMGMSMFVIKIIIGYQNFHLMGLLKKPGEAAEVMMACSEIPMVLQ